MRLKESWLGRCHNLGSFDTHSSHLKGRSGGDTITIQNSTTEAWWEEVSAARLPGHSLANLCLNRSLLAPTLIQLAVAWREEFKGAKHGHLGPWGRRADKWSHEQTLCQTNELSNMSENRRIIDKHQQVPWAPQSLHHSSSTFFLLSPPHPQQAFLDIFSRIAPLPWNVNTANTLHVCFCMVALWRVTNHHNIYSFFLVSPKLLFTPLVIFTSIGNACFRLLSPVFFKLLSHPAPIFFSSTCLFICHLPKLCSLLSPMIAVPCSSIIECDYVK